MELERASVGHDLVVGPGATVYLEQTAVRHDVVAGRPYTVQTGRNNPDRPGGTVTVGGDVLISGTPDFETFDGLCDLRVGHDLRVTNRDELFRLGIGDNCAAAGLPSDTIGHDLVVSASRALENGFFPSALEVAAPGSATT